VQLFGLLVPTKQLVGKIRLLQQSSSRLQRSSPEWPVMCRVGC